MQVLIFFDFFCFFFWFFLFFCFFWWFFLSICFFGDFVFVFVVFFFNFLLKSTFSVLHGVIILHTFTYLCACAPAFICVYRVLVCFRVYAHHLLRPRHTPPRQLPWASVQGADGMRLIALSILSQGYGSQLLEPTKIRWCLTRNHRFTVSEDFLRFHDKHPSKWPCTQASWGLLLKNEASCPLVTLVGIMKL